MNEGQTAAEPAEVAGDHERLLREGDEGAEFGLGAGNGGGDSEEGEVSAEEWVIEDTEPRRDGELRGGGMRRVEGAERMQMQRIRELDLEQLEVEEVDSDADNLQSDDDSSLDGRGDGGAGARGGFTFDTTLVSLHSYLGEVDVISEPRSFLNEGAILILPMFYLEGIVLFPDDTLPLRVLQPRFKAAVDRAMRQTDAPCTLGVIHVRARMRGSGVPMLSVGTTAEPTVWHTLEYELSGNGERGYHKYMRTVVRSESGKLTPMRIAFFTLPNVPEATYTFRGGPKAIKIRQLSRLSDGSMNVVTRGRQRFHIRKAWTDSDGAPCAQVQIIEEDAPLHIPRDAFSTLASVPHMLSGRVPRSTVDNQEGSDEEALQQFSSEGDYFDDDDSDSGREDRGLPFGLFGDDLDQWQREGDREGGEDESSEEEERLRWWRRRRRDDRNRRRAVLRLQDGEPSREDMTPSRVQEVRSSVEPMDQGETPATGNGVTQVSKKPKHDGGWGGACKAWAADESKWLRRAQKTTWPHWVYRMYDAYDLARRAADMLRQIVDLPRMEDLVRNPAMLSFFIASKMPLQDSTRQELLEVDGVVHRLRREIQLLESLDRLRCKTCMAVIARRSNVLVMSADGPINTFVNAGGYVHETLTLSRAWGLMLRGRPDTAHSWFPGYAWTIAHCSQCELHMGWRFTAVKKGMRPKAFWGVRRSQLAER